MKDWRATESTTGPDWIIYAMKETGDAAFPWRIEGDNLNYPEGHMNRRFSWRVPDLADARYLLLPSAQERLTLHVYTCGNPAGGVPPFWHSTFYPSPYVPEHLKRWTLPAGYFGAEWPEYFVFLSQLWDSSVLTRANFAAGLEAVGGESDTVVVVRNSHLACGWVEWIAIHESDGIALEAADEVARGLTDYPVVDGELYDAMREEEVLARWGRMDVRERAYMCREHGVSIFAARRTDEVPPMVSDWLTACAE